MNLIDLAQLGIIGREQAVPKADNTVESVKIKGHSPLIGKVCLCFFSHLQHLQKAYVMDVGFCFIFNKNKNKNKENK